MSSVKNSYAKDFKVGDKVRVKSSGKIVTIRFIKNKTWVAIEDNMSASYHIDLLEKDDGYCIDCGFKKILHRKGKCPVAVSSDNIPSVKGCGKVDINSHVLSPYNKLICGRRKNNEGKIYYCESCKKKEARR